MYLSKVKVKQEMESQGIRTFTELAERLGITKNQLSVMMSDSYNPLKARVEDLCQLLSVMPDKIMDFSAAVPVEAIVPRNRDVTAIELFAGAGGLALGLEQAGIKTVEYVEFDKACCETLKMNRPEWNVICDDIHNVDFTEYRDKVDIVTGGFPCQAFSYAGKKLGFEDTRGTLFHEFARCVQEVQPKMFLAENVRGLVSHDKGRTLETIINVFESLGYHTQQKILNACYYGVGQKRERIVIIGIRNDLDIHFEYPQPDEEWTTLRTALKDCPDSQGESYSERKRKVMELVPPGGCWVDLPEDVAFAGSRVRGETIAAEDVLHDMGAISIHGSDSQGMGRVGETVLRTWQMASKMKKQRGPLPEETGDNDNQRILRYMVTRKES